MVKGILGKKIGMTQIFTEAGKLLPVTIIKVEQNIVIQNKTVNSDGYNALQIGVEISKDKHLTRPMKGHFARAGVKPLKFIKELRLKEVSKYNVGDNFSVNIFNNGELVDITGISKGKGFAGCIKRHNFRRGPIGHGSKSHREPGSMGPRMSGGGGRVFKGKKLPGHMGAVKSTVQRLTIIKADIERGLLLIKGAIPGPKGGYVFIKNTVKPVI